jgi:transposase-like protein
MLHRALSLFGRKERQSTRLPRCPSCLSDRTAATISSSPEVYSFRCNDCQHEWAQLIRTPMPHWSDPID